ncbi:MAG: hypothetical protein N2690_02165 [Rhodocyclaceae bacterium]|nr:hypothetical protein [Rhodocyclaceae bacterium]
MRRSLTFHAVLALSSLSFLHVQLIGGEAQNAHAASNQQAQAAMTELDRLLAQLDAADKTDEIAMAGRKAADAAALQQSAKAGGAGCAPEPIPTAQQIAQGATVAPTVKSSEEDQDKSLITSKARNPNRQKEELLRQLDLIEGEQQLPNGQIVYVAVGQPVAIQFPPGSPGYIDARQTAYQIADLYARAEVANYLGTQIARDRDFSKVNIKEDTQQTLSPAEAAMQRAQQVADEQLDAELRKMGKDPQTYAALPPEKKRLVLAQTYQERAETKAAELLSGVSTLFVCEGPSDGGHAILVALIWSENTAKLVNAAFDPRLAGKPIPPDSRKRLMQRLPFQNPLQMARQFGAQLISDGAGNQWIVGFGQAGYTDANDRDIQEQGAFLSAQTAIAAFMSEQLDTRTRKEVLQIAQQLNDGSMTVQQASATLTNIRGRTNIQLSGVSRLTASNFILEGQRMVVVAAAWSPYQMQRAQAMRQKMEEVRKPQAQGQEQGPANQASQEEPTPRVTGAGHSVIGDW